ncbi:MAG: glyoxalase/bleomycin resistance/dioxygenase family protein [Gammaproteobacteria bacterium]|nr:glyoxalase/bleomycin resistance/dioxygenase family protein [Gammaproteobacteria bacterium]MDH5777406.1 glyoxalase/bleomycin resistance/dioxygenase family protein [Gammaproteobacteria bacterium]
MKKLHVHISVKDIEKSTVFYNELFATEPSKLKPDYVKWDLTNPSINFAISKHGKPGLNHLGIETENETELEELYQRINPIDANKNEEGETVCCYARSVKTWIDDPQKISWEIFNSLNDEEVYREKPSSACSKNIFSCC